MTKLALGIVGLGTAGAAMLDAARRHPGVNVAAVADARMADLPEVDGARGFGSLEDLLERGGVDAVHLATPTELHEEHVLQSLAAGVHIIVEKPVTGESAAGQRLVEAAASSGGAVIVGHSDSFEPYVQTARRLVRDGRIGALRSVTSVWATDWMRRPRHPEELDPRCGGGLVRRQGVHQMDAVRLVAGGGPVEVAGGFARPDTIRQACGGFVAWLALGDGVMGMIADDGTGGLVESPAAAAADEAAAKVSRTGGLLARVLAGEELQLGRTGTKLLMATGESGYLAATPDGVQVWMHGTRQATESVARMPDGRSATLDELLAAIAGEATRHTLQWGIENLAACETIATVTGADSIGVRGAPPAREPEGAR